MLLLYIKLTLCPQCRNAARPVGRGLRGHSPSALLLELGAEEQVSEQEDVAQLAGALHQLDHKAVLQQLPVLQSRVRAGVRAAGQPVRQPSCPPPPTIGPTFQSTPSSSLACEHACHVHSSLLKFLSPSWLLGQQKRVSGRGNGHWPGGWGGYITAESTVCCEMMVGEPL